MIGGGLVPGVFGKIVRQRKRKRHGPPEPAAVIGRP